MAFFHCIFLAPLDLVRLGVAAKCSWDLHFHCNRSTAWRSVFNRWRTYLDIRYPNQTHAYCVISVMLYPTVKLLIYQTHLIWVVWGRRNAPWYPLWFIQFDVQWFTISIVDTLDNVSHISTHILCNVLASRRCIEYQYQQSSGVKYCPMPFECLSN